MRGFQYKKAIQALNYFANKEGGEINKMKALKLIWLSDKYHINTYGRIITGDNYVALKNGPVASQTRDILQRENNQFCKLNDDNKTYASEFIVEDSNNKHKFKSISDVNFKCLSKTEVNTLAIIYDNYGKYNQFELSDISHEFSEWKKNEAYLKSQSVNSVPMLISDFFDKAPVNQRLFTEIQEDTIQYAKDTYKENIEIKNLFEI